MDALYRGDMKVAPSMARGLKHPLDCLCRPLLRSTTPPVP